MLPEFISFEFLSQPVPLWFALLMGFTAPYLWSGYIKQAATTVLSRYI
jgi:hypothetical protein